ncbi:hypothetical protein Tco_0055747 [Tanacetum coccineum]
MTSAILTNTIEADRKAKRFEQESQSQFIRDRDIIRDLEQQRDKLDLNVVELKRQTVELQKTQSILKQKMSENEDKYHDTVQYLEAKLNALYDDFVPQKELSDEQKYFPSSFISFEVHSNESSPYSSSETKPTKKSMPSANPI